ncbi:Hypothetical predicted protein, partial [Pelobates cultripes]
ANTLIARAWKKDQAPTREALIQQITTNMVYEKELHRQSSSNKYANLAHAKWELGLSKE